jgi:hypothetical protein
LVETSRSRICSFSVNATRIHGVAVLARAILDRCRLERELRPHLLLLSVDVGDDAV